MKKLVLAVAVCAVAQCAGWLTARSLCDYEGPYVRAWLQPRDVAEGDDISIRLQGDALGTNVVVEIDGDEEHYIVVEKIDGVVDDITVVAPLNRVAAAWQPIPFLVYVGLERQSGIGGVHIPLPVELRSGTYRTLARIFHRACAVVAGVAGFAIAYAAMRIRRRRRIESWCAVLVLLALAAAGYYAFVQPIAYTAVVYGFVTPLLLAAWSAVILAGAEWGLRARQVAARWQRAQIRTVIGTACPSVAYRETASLARDAVPATIDELARALRNSGLRVARRFGRIVVDDAAGRLARLRGPRRGRWTPATIAIDVFDGRSASRVVAALAAVFGAVEYTAPDGGVESRDLAVRSAT